VLAFAKGVGTDFLVPVVGGGVDDDVDVGTVEQFAVIAGGSGAFAPEFFGGYL